MKKNLFVLLFCISLFFTFGETENSTLKLANKYYDSDDYENSQDFFIKTILGGYYDGTVFYRLGYSLENTNDNDYIMKKCYEASYYCFTIASEFDNPYFIKAQNKVNQFDLTTSISETELEQTISMLKTFESNTETTETELDQRFIDIIISKIEPYAERFWYIFLIIGVLIYFVAYKLSKETDCVIVYGWKDIVVIALGMLCLGCEKELFFIPLLFFSVSIVFSIVGNIQGNSTNGFLSVILFTLVSLITKIILLIVIPIIIVCGILANSSGKTDRRYKDGTKNNERTANIAFFVAIVSSFFLPLIKSKQDL